MNTRAAMWEKLGGTVDLLVIGGGITGAGIARDAARRGLKVALIEMSDLASGTSSRSSKLVHGGLRYLEQYEFSLVFEAVSERRILLDIAPHLVNPLGFLFPVYAGSKQPLWLLEAGMWLYDGLSLFRSPKLHRTLKAKELAKEEPSLNLANIKGAPLYYDCATDDARMTLETALDAAGHGAVIATQTRVRSFLKDEQGRVCGVVVEDVATGALKEVAAHAVVNATGPWTDRTIALSGPSGARGLLRPTKGVHVVVARDRLPVKNAVVCIHPTDGRVLFAIPWGDHTYIGTTDTDYEGDPAEVRADAADVDYLIDAALAYFPQNPLSRSDIVSTWAGLRPLMAPPEAQTGVNESKVSREHQIVIGKDSLITIAGGKLTTYRRMAGEVVDTALNVLRLQNRMPGGLKAPKTDVEPLPGAVGWPADDDHAAVAGRIEKAGGGAVNARTARLLADTYGMRGLDLARLAASEPSLAQAIVPGRPEIMAQVDWAVKEELAAGVSDIFIRRTQLYYRDVEQGLGAVDRVADRMASLCGWTPEQREASAAEYRHEVALTRAWRDEVAS